MTGRLRAVSGGCSEPPGAGATSSRWLQRGHTSSMGPVGGVGRVSAACGASPVVSGLPLLNPLSRGFRSRSQTAFYSVKKENSGSSVTPRARNPTLKDNRGHESPPAPSRPGCRSCVRPCTRWCRVHPLSACRAAIGALGRRTSAQAETNITTVETRRLHLCCVMMLCRPCFWGALKLRLVPIFLTSRG